MIKTISGFMLVAFALTAGGCGSHQYLLTAPDGQALIDTSYLRANLRYLASDELRGRSASTEDAKVASNYLADQLQKYGVEPLGDSGTYFENFTMMRLMYPDSSSFDLLAPDGTVEHGYWMFRDFVVSSIDYGRADTTADVVFAGYGITAPEYGYDDYKTLDVREKIVLLWPGEPVSHSKEYFNDTMETKYSDHFTKAANAIKHGARAVFLISKRTQGVGWDKAIESWRTGAGMMLPPDQGEPAEAAAPTHHVRLYLRDSTLRAFFAGEEHAFDEIAGLHAKGAPLPLFTLRHRVHLKTVPYVMAPVPGRNVVGVVRGTDPSLADQYVALGAHYDHVGVNGGQVYNGADDDGSGTVAVLETARAFSRSRSNRRPILIAFHTAEELGLFGSEYLTSHLPVMKQVTAQVNIDMVGRESVDSIYCIGSGRMSTELYDAVRRVNTMTVGMNLDYTFDDPKDPNHYYERSDHFNYAKRGIPIVFFFDGMTADYHQPGDKVEKIDFEKLRKVTTLASSLLLEIANRRSPLAIDKPVQ